MSNAEQTMESAENARLMMGDIFKAQVRDLLEQGVVNRSHHDTRVVFALALETMARTYGREINGLSEYRRAREQEKTHAE